MSNYRVKKRFSNPTYQSSIFDHTNQHAEMRTSNQTHFRSGPEPAKVINQPKSQPQAQQQPQKEVSATLTESVVVPGGNITTNSYFERHYDHTLNPKEKIFLSQNHLSEVVEDHWEGNHHVFEGPTCMNCTNSKLIEHRSWVKSNLKETSKNIESNILSLDQKYLQEKQAQEERNRVEMQKIDQWHHGVSAQKDRQHKAGLEQQRLEREAMDKRLQCDREFAEKQIQDQMMSNKSFLKNELNMQNELKNVRRYESSQIAAEEDSRPNVLPIGNYNPNNRDL